MQGRIYRDETYIALLVEIERFIELETHGIRAAAFLGRARDGVVN